MRILIGAFILSLLLFAGLRELINLIPQEPDRPIAAPFVSAQQDGQAVDPAPSGGGLRPHTRPSRQESCTAAKLHPQEHQPFTAAVTRVIDGDTLEARVEGQTFRVRLWGIDAPESDQPMGEEARQHLAHLAPENSALTLHPVSMDQYGRLIAVMEPAAGSEDWAVNVQLVAFGLAYHVDRYESAGNACLREAENTARHSRAGVWQAGARGGARPWDHRKK